MNSKPEQVLFVPSGEDPHTYQQAMKCLVPPFWEGAKKYKMMMINHLSIYKSVLLPSGQQAVGSKWVYKVKCDINSDIVIAWLPKALLNSLVLTSLKPMLLLQESSLSSACPISHA